MPLLPEGTALIAAGLLKLPARPRATCSGGGEDLLRVTVPRGICAAPLCKAAADLMSADHCAAPSNPPGCAAPLPRSLPSLASALVHARRRRLISSLSFDGARRRRSRPRRRG